ncbi:hypothetical protein SV7mr_37240 [Stieleria bergensis]|uniref:Uncharacterized protein n=1 Tax=Stieleria bergensis TaxID=2528025 RepID=A0A517SYM4_9BACT|nr:hypothetical protein SV7mr_37240 [Planctomycetes bacterium SV_7m_r]
MNKPEIMQRGRFNFPVAVGQRAAIGLALLVFVGAVAGACNIPVFRYALERWKPDQAELVIFHDAPLTESQQTLAEKLTRATVAKDQGTLNAEVRFVNVIKNSDDELTDLWRSWNEQGKPLQLPMVLARTKVARGKRVNHFHGPLEDQTVTQFLQSPIRRQLRERLLAGHSVVWLLVRGKNEPQNQAARNTLNKTMRQLERTIELPEGIGLPGSELYADTPLVVQFSLLEMDANDARERMLASLLTGIRKQAFEEGQPLLVPVFGRGRALEVIPGEDLSAGLISELTRFLSGACSCQVKEQNPGFDLMIAADWDQELFGGSQNRPPDRSSQEGQNREPEYVPIPPG